MSFPALSVYSFTIYLFIDLSDKNAVQKHYTQLSSQIILIQNYLISGHSSYLFYLFRIKLISSFNSSNTYLLVFELIFSKLQLQQLSIFLQSFFIVVISDPCNATLDIIVFVTFFITYFLIILVNCVIINFKLIES